MNCKKIVGSWIASLIVLGSFAWSNTAQAQEVPERAFRLSLEMPIMGVYHDRFTDDNSTSSLTYFQAGVGGARVQAPADWELPMLPEFELGIGGKISRNLVIGAKIQAIAAPGKYKYEYEDPEFPEDNYTSEANVTQAALGILPYLEIMSSKASKVRPFFTVAAGFRTNVIKLTDDDDEDSFTITTPRAVGRIGGGLHFFFVPRCSVDFSFLAMVEFGKTKFKEEYTFSGTTETDEDEVDTMRIGGDIALGISAWI